jgi:hypothetical protein
MKTARRANLSGGDLEAAPGAGLAQPRGPFARRLGRRANVHAPEISKARDRSARLCISARSRITNDSTHQRDLATATAQHRPPPWPQQDRRAKRALLFQPGGIPDEAARA